MLSVSQYAAYTTAVDDTCVPESHMCLVVAYTDEALTYSKLAYSMDAYVFF